jgi:hypothetical protein
VTDQGRAREIPEELWLGKQFGEWPVQAFTTKGHVVGWLAGRDDRRAWRVRVEVLAEVALVMAEPRLEDKQ